MTERAKSMAAASQSPSFSSPPFRGLKKVLSKSRRSSESQRDAASQYSDFKSSVQSLSLERSPTRSARSSPSRDGSSHSGESGMRKLIPGHAKRKRRKLREEELKAAIESADRGRSDQPVAATVTESSLSPSRSDGSPLENSLLTDDSDPDTTPRPPMVSRESHTGFLSSSSPLITTTTVDGYDEHALPRSQSNGLSIAPPLRHPSSFSADTSPTSLPVPDSSLYLSTSSPGLIDKADSLRPQSTDRTNRLSIARSIRSISPARKLRDAFNPSRAGKSPKTSPERQLGEPSTEPAITSSSSFTDNRMLKNADQSTPSIIDTRAEPPRIENALSTVDTDRRPQTPPAAVSGPPVTTVTPPTPTESTTQGTGGSPRRATEAASSSDIIVSASGNMISHRRARSSSSISHGPSKLSSSMTAPLTPTLEEAKGSAATTGGARNFTPGGGFFSSWVSAAQNAASNITSTLNTQTRSRSSTNNSDSGRPKISEETIKEESPAPKTESPRRKLAIETLGTGDLSFGHLGIDGVEDARVHSLRPDLEELRKNSTVQRDEAAAKIEDMLAKRAVTAAYETPKYDKTPLAVAEIPDPMNNARPFQSISAAFGDEHTPSNGSIFDSDTGSVKHSNSVRSKLRNRRRSRGSSAATGTSAIGAALVSASTSALANPAGSPRFGAFAVAPKPRNRTFHQLFRSVPEDDYLVEDYSCALQKDILVAGRIYISEGHICFSANILGWVTTLVISFEEVVSVERETTAMIIPNAIAIQTLHARHTFRSLLSREATYDLLIGIWKVSHPAAFKKSVNGKAMEQADSEKSQVEPNGIAERESDEEDEEEDEDDEDEDEEEARSFAGSHHSNAGSEAPPEIRVVKRQLSSVNGNLVPVASTAFQGASDAPKIGDGKIAGSDPSVPDFPGPVTHGATECTDSSSHYDKIIKDEIIPAPLGKVYNLLYGSASGAFVRKYLVEECKVLDLDFDLSSSLTATGKSRQYSYIKPLGGSIGPKQTKCITTEMLDFLDLEKSVSVTCTTQTPDVPNGGLFSVKTRYCLSWAEGNSTRLQMNCTIEWTGKSWLKGPIEKGANDGQQTYADGLVKVLRAAVVPARSRAATNGSKGIKGKKKRKGEKGGLRADDGEKAITSKSQASWGVFEFARGPLEPVAGLVNPLMLSVSLILVFVVVLWLSSGSASSGLSYGGPYPGFGSAADRLAAYDEMWRREEGELWTWLEERVGLENLGKRLSDKTAASTAADKARKTLLASARGKAQARDVEARLREEKMSQREMEDAIRVTKDRLRVLETVVQKRRANKG